MSVNIQKVIQTVSNMKFSLGNWLFLLKFLLRMGVFTNDCLTDQSTNDWLICLNLTGSCIHIQDSGEQSTALGPSCFQNVIFDIFIDCKVIKRLSFLPESLQVTLISPLGTAWHLSSHCIAADKSSIWRYWYSLSSI